MIQTVTIVLHERYRMNGFNRRYLYRDNRYKLNKPS